MESRRILAVHGEDGLCELTVTAPTLVSELRDGTIREYTITAEEMGLRPGKLDDIRTDSAEESAQMILAILSGEDQGTPRDMASNISRDAPILCRHGRACWRIG